MKITAFYYMKYPDLPPPDEFAAASEVYLEVTEDGGSIDDFDLTYSVMVYTIGHIVERIKTHGFFCAKGGVVVDRFDDPSIKAALEAILPNIEAIAERK